MRDIGLICHFLGKFESVKEFNATCTNIKKNLIMLFRFLRFPLCPVLITY